MEHLATMIIYQSLERQAILEAFGSKQNVENMKQKVTQQQKELTKKLQKKISGHKSFKSFFSRKSKEEQISQLEEKVKIKTKTIEDLTTLYDIILLLHGYYEIDYFKKEKSEKYYNTISRMVDV